MKKKLLLSALALTFLLTTCGQAATAPAPTAETPAAATEADAEVFAQFENELEDLRQKLKIPSFSAAIVQDQELVWAKGFGHADLKNKVKATPDTPYLLASVTKPIAATIIMQLVEEGVLDLDDPVSKYGIDLESQGVVRVWHLLTHTSEGVPGTHHNYSGYRYALLAEVIEGASGKSFRELLSERILEPFDMRNTAPNYSSCDLEGFIASPGPDERDRNYARVYRELAKPYQLDQSYGIVEGVYHALFNTGAGLISTVVDLAKFDIALDQNVLLSQETKEKMFTPAFSTYTNSTELMYGLGWYTQRYKGTRLIWHSGRMPPSISALYLKVPEERLTFIILANTDNLTRPYPLGEGDVLYSTLALTFYKTFIFPRQFGKTVLAVDWEADRHDLVNQLKQIADKDVREILERELWSYRQVFGSVGRTELVNRLLDVHRQAYRGSRAKDLDLRLSRAVEQFPRVGERIELSEAELGRFVGQYGLSRATEVEGDSPPLDVSVELYAGNLIVCAPSDTPRPLVPIAPTRFRILRPDGDPIGYVEFHMDGDRVETVTAEINDTIEIVYEPKE